MSVFDRAERARRNRPPTTGWEPLPAGWKCQTSDCRASLGEHADRWTRCLGCGVTWMPDNVTVWQEPQHV